MEDLCDSGAKRCGVQCTIESLSLVGERVDVTWKLMVVTGEEGGDVVGVVCHSGFIFRGNLIAEEHTHADSLTPKEATKSDKSVPEIDPEARRFSERDLGAHDHLRDKPLEWRKGQLLGRGAYGSVWLGMSVASGMLLAVKEILYMGHSEANISNPNPSPNHNPNPNCKAERELISSFEMEVSILREPNSNPNPDPNPNWRFRSSESFLTRTSSITSDVKDHLTQSIRKVRHWS